jgi:hypothetical protein
LEGLKKGQNDSTLDNNRAVVYVAGGTLELRNGTITGNTTNTEGGVYSIGTFNKSGGIIYGNDAANITDRNTANYKGHAMYYSSTLYRNTTLGENDNISSNRWPAGSSKN